MDFYEKLTVEKAKRKLNNKALGAIIGMEGEAFRMATNRKSFNNLQIKEIEKFFELENSTSEEIIHKKQIPFYDIDFYSSFITGFQENVQPAFWFYHPDFERAEFAVKNSGQSMSSIIGHGDIVGMRNVKDWQSYFPQGEVYGLVTSNNMRTIKVVRNSTDETKYRLIPKPSEIHKNDFPDFEEISKENVLQLFQVVASMNCNKLAL